MRPIFLLVFLAMSIKIANAQTFRAEQKKFERVNTAYREKWPTLEKKLATDGFGKNFTLFLAAYKNEGLVEVWLKDATKKQYALFTTYKFCEHSGTLGPKVKEGDLQTPEGFYYISVFNPVSSFHLSLGLNYPNAADLKRSGNNPPGSDIYIHGNCVTVGCIPLTDELIKELYVLAVEARSGGQVKIPVHIYPFKMTDANLKKFSVQYPSHANFWKTLQPSYKYFERHKLPG